MSKPKRLREIEYGLCAGDGMNKTCIYTTGRLDPKEFLQLVANLAGSDVPLDARQALTEDDVEHTHFRPMSPSEAKSWGGDTGVMVAEPGHRGYEVTRVVL